jgi:protein SCO1/2
VHTLRRTTCWLLAVATFGIGASSAFGQYQRPQAGEVTKPQADAALKRSREAAGINEKVGNVVPRDLTFTNAQGETITVGDILDQGRPVILQLAYYRCPALCGEVINGMARGMRGMTAYTIGTDFEVVTVSFDSREPASLAADNKEATVDALARAGIDKQDASAGWNFWVGDDANIAKLADSVGFRFAWIEEAQEYSHPGTVVLLTPDGVISRYMHGTSYDPQALRLNLVEASEGTLRPTLGDAFIYYCFAYDPTTGKYTATARTVMMIGGGVTMFTLTVVIGFLLLAERRGRRQRAESTPPEGGAFA